MTQVMAHRGASRACPENTIAAFHAAVALGADLVEFDVRLTADGALAVHHDPVLADGRALHRTPAADLPETVPLLAAALDACRPLPVNVEIKNSPREPGFDPHDRAAVAVAAVVAAHDLVGRVIVSSFHLPALDRIRAADPAIETAYLVRRITGSAWLRAAVVERGHRGVHPWHGLLTRRHVERCRSLGLAVRPWTVDDPGRVALLARWGVDAVCTNVPDVARQALTAARG
jgi:glycerophosphoryl diester phosphodiesterase